ncbi:putative calcium-dependent protein kinase [Gregarina niphandrodes]|uniref:non-specific serine/threonine protein kinase n=1 Tax=Gregarina niphandrodes TaxID=110365 RepID=A0A023B6E0_GRENI|nr:putative calcium-dependent protein kinase [Gregarina niphandrodes]EZG65883.1 putative calcium-dependent protein kinase [Gregarina niphandrodes]|eukprot:XP_011134041.1 putative calcium-dependent protein kinase [Gregarina niphandrodes]
MQAKLDNVLGDKNIFIKSARASFKQFDMDHSNSLNFAECQRLIQRLSENLALPPVDPETLRGIFDRFNTSDSDELSAEDFTMMFWQILWRVRERYYPSKTVPVRRSFFVGRTAIGDNQIKSTLFHFEKLLGQGSFGQAFMVIEKSSRLERCCKVINKDKAKVPIEQIEAEVTVLKSLDHPNVIKILDVYEDYHNLYIVQDLCTGGELLKRLSQAHERAKLLTEKYVREIMNQVLKALAYIHEMNVVHKDLKPENIMFADKGVHSEIKVIDFGLAEMFEDQNQMSTHGAGTILYMAPEVFAGWVTIKCDMWSAGVVMFQLLTGRLPFPGRSVPEVKTKIMRQDPPFREYCRHLSEEGVDLLRKLLDKNPKTRLSAKAALKHAWFESARPSTVELDADVCANLANYARHSNFKAALINLMAHQLNFNSVQIRRVTEIFRQFDEDNNGILSRSELAKGLDRAGFEKWEINKIVQALDVDGSGDISYTEFLAAAYTWRESELNIIWTAFNKLDRDHDGCISVEEFVELLSGQASGTGETSKLIKKDEIANILNAVDRNKDGIIDWQEFLAYMKSEN